MLRKIFKKRKDIEFTLPIILGHGLKKKNDKSKKKETNFSKDYIIDKFINFFFDKKNDSHLFKLTRRPLLIGIIVIITFFGIFGLWAAFAQIEGSVVANGQVTSLSNRKIIQHLEGGVIEKISVREGDEIKKGSVLINLRNISSKSQKTIFEEKLYNLKVTEARLIAERDGKEKIEIGDKQTFTRVFDNQQRLFVSRKNNLESQIAILNNRIQQSNKEKEAVRGKLSSEEQQIKLVKEELENKQKLFVSGNIDRPSVIALEKQLAILTAKIAEGFLSIAKIDQQISNTGLEILNIQNKFQNDVITELKGVQADIFDIEKKLFTIVDVFDRTEIRAPQSGIVTNLQYHTIGGVIPSGAKIMEIIPINDDLVIEAKILPKDIDAVLHAKNTNIITIDNITGSAIKVRILALNTRKVGLLEGVMTNVSADTIVDSKNSAMQYYLAQIRIPKSQLKSIANKQINLYPGMPALVFIITESRTLLSYLLSPISSTLDTAFRER